jgi:hemerythrin-like metal-binding protein
MDIPNRPNHASGDASIIDQEHNAQLTLLDALETAIRDDHEHADLYASFQRLVEHTNLHFLSEQLSMREHAYDAYETHVEEHERLMAEIRDIQADLENANKTKPRHLIAALRRWLVVHMETMDQSLEEFLKRERVKSGAAGSRC